MNVPRRKLGSGACFVILAAIGPIPARAGEDVPRTVAPVEAKSSGEAKPGGAAGVAAGGYRGYWIPYYAVGWPNGEVSYYTPPFVLYTPAGPIVTPSPMLHPIPVSIRRGPLTSAPPAPAPAADPIRPPARPNPRRDSARAAQLVVLGDRHFRADNLKRAEERYAQAEKLDPSSAAIQLRMAQIALVRLRYTEAAHRLRDAEIAQPGWILAAPDIQSLYGEPADFARHLNRLESHLQAHPDDQDAWLVLGAQCYLSGRTARAADVFARLHDPHRKPDIALAAFLEATNQR
ncbi:tetratricopeptide repeat protein [Aquisphaera insulae]|uniref:tetratricopeptide repeat protein n=1 Tax=Aquisphaera insulae TaxID=2712864 RepID=UPI00196B2F62|nr:tetratricopeptide repeat protein [Aquisphaera insulae]